MVVFYIKLKLNIIDLASDWHLVDLSVKYVIDAAVHVASTTTTLPVSYDIGHIIPFLYMINV